LWAKPHPPPGSGWEDTSGVAEMTEFYKIPKGKSAKTVPELEILSSTGERNAKKLYFNHAES
jgi:hypothetical protein